MRRFFVCAAFCLLLPTNLSAWFEADLTPPGLRPTSTSFAYKERHSAYTLPEAGLSALWFSGEDRELPRETVAEPIIEVPARAARPVPSRNALCSHAAAIATEYDLPVPFFANLIQQESGFRTHVVSPAGAQGIAQFMPRVARAYGLENPFEPVHALAVSAKFLRELLGQFGNLGLAAAAYNAGPRRVQDWMARRGKLPEETRNYVRNITGHPAERWARVKAKTEETRLPPHARCPGMPAIEVSIPGAAPVKVAKGKSKASSKVAAASKELPKLAAAKASGPKMPKSHMLASAAAGKKTAAIGNGKLQIMAPEKGSKPSAGKKRTAAKAAAKKTKSAARTRTAVRTAAKAAGESAAKAAAKSKSAAKSQSKPPSGKRAKYAAAR